MKWDKTRSFYYKTVFFLNNLSAKSMSAKTVVASTYFNKISIIGFIGNGCGKNAERASL